MKRRTFFRIFWITLTVLTLCFIWSNSLRHAAASTEQSGRLVSFLCSLALFKNIPEDTLSFIVRKAAHFCEFALLGLETGGVRSVFPVLKKSYFFLFPVVCALADEGLQLFSDRTASLWDVLLDSCGAACGLCVFFLCARLFGKMRERRFLC